MTLIFLSAEEIIVGEHDREWIITQVFDKDVLSSTNDCVMNLIDKLEEGNDMLENKVKIDSREVATLQQRIALLEQTTVAAEQRSIIAEQRATEAQNEARHARERSEEEQRRLDEHLQRVLPIQAEIANNGIPSWMVQRQDIHVTDEVVRRGRWGPVKIANFQGLRVTAKIIEGIAITQHNVRLYAREHTIAAQLRHPNLVQFIGATIERVPIILEELLPTNLRIELGRERFTQRQIISVSINVALALNYLHKKTPQPIIHRDISSANVLLQPIGGEERWMAKVLNSSTANFLRQTETERPGDVLYAAPEAIYPNQHSSKMDVYSFGILIMEAATSQLPIMNRKAQQIQQMHWPVMEGIVNNCTTLEKENRPEISDILERLRRLN